MEKDITFSPKTKLLILLFIGLMACHSPWDYVKQRPIDQIIERFSVQPITGELHADGESILRAQVVLNKDADTQTSSVTFRIGEGKFVQNDSNVLVVKPTKRETYGHVSVSCFADIRSPLKATSTVVYVSVGGVSRDTIVTFPRLLADSITINTGKKFSLAPGLNNSLTVQANLSRKKLEFGKPSSEAKVEFIALAIDSINAPSTKIGFFIPDTQVSFTDEKGSATVEYSVGSTNYRKRIAFIAKTLGNTTDTVNGKPTIVEKIISDTSYVVVQ